ncbi:alpha/beta hydrolase [Saccharopolyspora sp. K220]|uniref:alpha/beta fold hydrolase n=1 Tax=Saccharopolyspora soli TaxID=2926618 RepID=UPI001F574908|nr:alpha/beta fold hydrolase [Saccharopolyspora soli]MCI2422374.1 alpha/beta hydrolase [Saccharopolyspora soli]
MIKSLRLGLALALTAPLISAAPGSAAEPPRFSPCPADPAVECAEIAVPLDYAEPTGRQLSIAISRIKASGTPQEYRGALLVNPGGPGGAGLDYAASKRAKMPEAVQRAYDIIGFDPRGVGQSDPVDCGPLGGLFQHPGPEPVPTTATEERAFLERLRTMAIDCRQHGGSLLPHINTANTARDMDRIRQALNQPTLNFLGVSYGSYLAAAYAAEFPSRVGRMVLDNVVSPQRWLDFDVRQGFAMSSQRDVLFGWIASHPSFGLGSTPDAVRSEYLRARSALAARPGRGTFGAAEFDYLVYRTLSRTERWEPFARALSSYVHNGEHEGLGAELPEAESGNYGAALRTVKCADSSRPSTAEVLEAVRSLRGADPPPILAGLEATACRY